MGYQHVSLECADQVAVVTLRHPEVLNAIGATMLRELGEAIRAVAAPATGARCLVLTGEGRGFCSRANLADSEAAAAKSPGEWLREAYHPLFLAIRDLDMPVVTAVNGVAAGIGMSFAMMGDIVCAAKSAYFTLAFANIGLVPDGGATFLLPRLVGWSRAVELGLLAERLPAEQALQWGLVNRLYADEQALRTGAMEIARRLADGPRSLALMRRAFWTTWQNDYEAQLELEATLQDEAARSADFREGVAAFRDRRRARFTGR